MQSKCHPWCGDFSAAGCSDYSTDKKGSVRAGGASLKMPIMEIEEESVGKPLWIFPPPASGRVVNRDVPPEEFVVEP